jgi:hypothetical protein
MHPTGKGIGVSTFSAIPPNDGANHGVKRNLDE